jgi:peptidoglycan/LPS O-acetylase OafA/YrhL
LFGLIPEENAQLGKHIATATVFASNLLLWNESGYFDVNSEMKPLLHLWSLGIEEQFYAFAPVLFLLLHRTTKRLSLVLTALAFASFGLNLALVNSFPIANFYSPLSRMFELLAGSLLAVSTLRSQQTSVSAAPLVRQNLAALAGMVLIAGSIFGITRGMRFPGFVVLAPVAGTILLIYSGTGSLLNRYLLSNPLVVWLGLISYPLYLWHWPLLVFARIVYSDNPSGGVRLGLVAVAVVLAILVYVYVEKPFRAGRVRHPVLILVVAMVAAAACGLASYLGKGKIAHPIPHLYQKIYDGDFGNNAFYEEMEARFRPCESATLLARAPKYGEIARCFQSKKGEPVTAIVVGDSHAEALFPGLAANLPDRNIAYYVSGYAPILGNLGFASFFDEIQTDRNITSVILAAYWIASTAYAIPEGSSFESELEKAVTMLTRAGKRVYLIVDNPSFTFPPEQCRYSRLPGRDPKCDQNVAAFIGQRAEYIGTFRKIEATNANVKVIDTSGLFCDNYNCSMVKDGTLLYRDYNHLNVAGSLFVGARIASQIN